MRVLVTGGTGFVGACLARALVHAGHEVHLAVRDGHQTWRLDEIARDVRLHTAHLERADSVRACFDAVRPQWVFHLAAYGAYSTQNDADQMVATNLAATIHLVEAAIAARVVCFVNTGSSSEYGFKDHAPGEEEVLDPNSPYAVTKAGATQYCRYAARRSGMKIPTLRLYSVYGPYEEPTRLIPTLILAGEQGRLPPLVNPKVARDFVYVDDVCRAYLRAAEAQLSEPGATFNIGSGVQTTLAQAVEVARATFGITTAPVWETMPNRSWDTASWVSRPERAARELGWKAQTTFEEGFRKTATWLKSTPVREAYLGADTHR